MSQLPQQDGIDLTFMQRVSSTPDHERNYGVCRRSEAEVVKIFDGIDREI